MSENLMERLCRPTSTARTEADIQSDIQTLLSSKHFRHHGHTPKLEEQIGDGTQRRIDVAIGATVIEVKKSLDDQTRWPAYETQLAGYVATRRRINKSRYNGILTDGRIWRLYEEDPATKVFTCVSTFILASADRGRALTEWLQAVLATHAELKPTERSIETYLGATSPAYAADRAFLHSLYNTVRAEPAVALKRELWARLLRSSLGTDFADDTALFIDHTLLVLEAMAIGHAVMGFDPSELSADVEEFISGDLFRASGVYNVMEAGFFDWVVLAGTDGETFIQRLIQRIGVFDWSKTEHDVLKVLYESVITAETRKGLGEYYTPDWLAEGMVEKVLTDPLKQRAMDPSCGSGTFIYALVRRIVSAAEEAGWDDAHTVDHIGKHVAGLDIHPVSIVLARVTYLLALGEKLSGDRGDVWVPIHLGDSMQWGRRTGEGTDVIQVGVDGDDLTLPSGIGQDGLFPLGDVLRFPLASIDDAWTFDRLVTDLTERAKSYTDASKRVPDITKTLNGYGIRGTDDISQLKETFRTLCHLNADGRDTIWGFFIRNQVRPTWLSMADGKVDILVGNPPWVAYRHMTASMQEQFKRFSEDRNLWHGKKLATQQDLVGLFIVRCVEHYLAKGGRFGFVTPLALLSRQQYEGFRAGVWGNQLEANMDEVWDLDGVKPKGALFPVPAAVVFGSAGLTDMGPSREHLEHGMTETKTVVTGSRDRSGWTATLPNLAFTPKHNITMSDADVVGSQYAGAAIQGATIVPRSLSFVVEGEAPSTRLGMARGSVAVTSMRTSQEKKPWKELPSLEAVVESRFVFDVHLGSTVVPFRLLDPWRAVLPVKNAVLMTEKEIADTRGLKSWWGQASQVWEENKSPKTTQSLREWVNYQAKLARQLNPPRHRVLYSASGNSLAAVRSADPAAVIEHALYWLPTKSRREAQYLASILNAPITTQRVSEYQSRGLFGARHFDTYVWRLPIPLFDDDNDLHSRIVDLSQQAEEVAAGLDLDGVGFQAARKKVREALTEAGITAELDDAVGELLGPLEV